MPACRVIGKSHAQVDFDGFGCLVLEASDCVFPGWEVWVDFDDETALIVWASSALLRKGPAAIPRMAPFLVACVA